MSYKLKDVLDELEGGGMITTDDDLVVATLNGDLGLNIHHDLVITSEEKSIMRNALTALQVLAISNADDFLQDLSERALYILEKGND